MKKLLVASIFAAVAPVCAQMGATASVRNFALTEDTKAVETGRIVEANRAGKVFERQFCVVSRKGRICEAPQIFLLPPSQTSAGTDK